MSGNYLTLNDLLVLFTVVGAALQFKSRKGVANLTLAERLAFFILSGAVAIAWAGSRIWHVFPPVFTLCAITLCWIALAALSFVALKRGRMPGNL